jgi:GDP-L-fucose synthase
MNDPNTTEISRLQDGKIFVAGHRGMVGSALVRRLEEAGCRKLILKSRSELDLTDPRGVGEFMRAEKPDYVFIAAAKVGGINANNSCPAEFIYQNLMIAANLVDASHAADIHRLLFLGSSCIYPRLAPQPMAEDSLLTGTLEPTNEPYAIAKIAGIKLCESYNRQYETDFRSVMPTNLYGPNDNFDLATSHALPALIRKFHEARESGAPSVEVWGTGAPRREFLHVDDLADACLFTICLPKPELDAAITPMASHINVGTGKDISIGELAEVVRTAVGYSGEIRFNTDYPDGTPQKLLDVSLMSNLGWNSRISLADGISMTCEWYGSNNSE